MEIDAEDKRTGIEILFEERVRDTIFMNPSRELTDKLYSALDLIGFHKYDCQSLGPVKVSEIKKSPELVQPYSILCKMGLLTTKTEDEIEQYDFTSQGKEVYKSLRDENVFNTRLR